jgi:hypothetical protein
MAYLCGTVACGVKHPHSPKRGSSYSHLQLRRISMDHGSCGTGRGSGSCHGARQAKQQRAPCRAPAAEGLGFKISWEGKRESERADARTEEGQRACCPGCEQPPCAPLDSNGLWPVGACAQPRRRQEGTAVATGAAAVVDGGGVPPASGASQRAGRVALNESTCCDCCNPVPGQATRAARGANECARAMAAAHEAPVCVHGVAGGPREPGQARRAAPASHRTPTLAWPVATAAVTGLHELAGKTSPPHQSGCIFFHI